jgi:hypothetical protein
MEIERRRRVISIVVAACVFGFIVLVFGVLILTLLPGLRGLSH